MQSEDGVFRTQGLNNACLNAAAEGHLDVLQYLRGLADPFPWDEQVCYMAAVNGHLEVLNCLRELGCPWRKDLCLVAARRHPAVYEWVQAAAE